MYAFGKLIEMGAMPFLPIADTRGVDTVVQKKNGTYAEIQVKAIWPPKQAGHINVPDLLARKNFFIVGLIYAKLLEVTDGTPEVWIIPSEIFAENTTERRQLGLGCLDLGTTKHERSLSEKLANYCEAWHLLTR